MCLALYKPAKARVLRREMAQAFQNNPDGAGFAYYDPAMRQVVIQRGYYTFKSLWRDLRITMDENLPAIIHFRWATHGGVDRDNCHPFPLKDGALIHNGIISQCGDDDGNWWERYGDASKSYSADEWAAKYGDGSLDEPDRSDTRVFVEDYLKGMGRADMEHARHLIEGFIGFGNKLVTLHDDGRVLIFNEHLGHWKNGCWYSNYSYRPAHIDKGGSSSKTTATATATVKMSSGPNGTKVTTMPRADWGIPMRKEGTDAYGRTVNVDTGYNACDAAAEYMNDGPVLTYADLQAMEDARRDAMNDPDYAGELCPDMPEYAG